MTCKISYLYRWVCFVIVLLMAVWLEGCCGRKKITDKKKGNSTLVENIKKKSNKKFDKKNNTQSISENEFGDIDIDLSGELPLRPSDERTNELYEKFDYANKMYKDRNYDSALREINRIKQSINNDPYLMMQVYAFEAMVYGKKEQPGRRKHSYKKMMEAMTEVQKDNRYKKAYSDGMICQDLIASATKIGEKRYDFE